MAATRTPMRIATSNSGSTEIFCFGFIFPLISSAVAVVVISANGFQFCLLI